MDHTPNFNLRKPSTSDNYNVEDQNVNMDKIDEELGDTQQTLITHLDEFAQYRFGERPYTSSEDKTYYIDQLNGDDNNDGETEATAFASWEKAMSMIPKTLAHVYTIRFVGDYEPIDGRIYIEDTKIIRNRHGADTSSLFIESLDGTKITMNGIIFCSAIVAFSGGSTGGLIVRNLRMRQFYVSASFGVRVELCEFIGNAQTGFVCGYSLVAIYNCIFLDDAYETCIQNRYASTLVSSNNSGRGTSYGLSATNGSEIVKVSGPQPTGSSSNESTVRGGLIR